MVFIIELARKSGWSVRTIKCVCDAAICLPVNSVPASKTIELCIQNYCDPKLRYYKQITSQKCLRTEKIKTHICSMPSQNASYGIGF